MAPELVIFDCDGVLVDSEPIAVRTEVRLLAEVGWPLTEQEVLERFVGRSDADVLAAIEAQVGRPLPDWRDRYHRELHAAFDAELTAVDGVAAAIDAVEAAGVATCVASSGSHDKMRRTLGRTGLWERFEGRIFSSSEVAHGKPAPDLFLHAAASMGAAPERCVVVEDSRAGAAAARAAGMRCIGFAGGLTPAAWLEAEGAEVITDMVDLPALVLAGSVAVAEPS